MEHAFGSAVSEVTYATGSLTLTDAGEALGVSPSTLRVQIKKGRLAATKIGKTWVVSPEEVARYGEAHLRRQPVPPRPLAIESDSSLAAVLIRSSTKLGEAAELAITGNRQRALDAARAEIARLRRLPKR